MPSKQPDQPEYFGAIPNGVFPLYHWSPSINRAEIAERGLRVRSKATQGDWRPPFIAFATSPQLAWLLSAARTDYEVAHHEWDLWSTWSERVNQWERLDFDHIEGTKELRVYRSIPAKHLWYVGSRSTQVDALGRTPLFVELMEELDALDKND